LFHSGFDDGCILLSSLIEYTFSILLSNWLPFVSASKFRGFDLVQIRLGDRLVSAVPGRDPAILLGRGVIFRFILVVLVFVQFLRFDYDRCYFVVVRFGIFQ